MGAQGRRSAELGEYYGGWLARAPHLAARIHMPRANPSLAGPVQCSLRCLTAVRAAWHLAGHRVFSAKNHVTNRNSKGEMGYWKSKVLPKIKKVFATKKAAPEEAATEATKASEEAKEEASKAKEVVVEGGEEKKEEAVEKPAEEEASTATPAPAPAAEEIAKA